MLSTGRWGHAFEVTWVLASQTLVLALRHLSHAEIKRIGDLDFVLGLFVVRRVAIVLGRSHQEEPSGHQDQLHADAVCELGLKRA